MASEKTDLRAPFTRPTTITGASSILLFEKGRESMNEGRRVP